MSAVDHFLVYMQPAVKYRSLYIHHPGGAARPRGGVYRGCCILGSLHVHEEIVYTSHFLIFSRPKPGGGVYIWCPHDVYRF